MIKRRSDSYSIDEEKFLVHFQDNKESVVIVGYEEEINHYYRFTYFAADVVDFLLENPKSTFNDIAGQLSPLYDANDEELRDELTKVLQKLTDCSIL